MTAPAEPVPEATVHVIHRELGRQYDSAHTAGYLLIMNRCGTEPLDMLTAMREEATPKAWGHLTPRERGSLRGQLDALDMLIDERNGADR